MAKIDTTNDPEFDQHVGASYQSPEPVIDWVRRWNDQLEGAIACGFKVDA